MLDIIKDKIEVKDKRKKIKACFDYYSKPEKGQIGFSTFHQSMSYEDFIEGIKPLPPEDDDEGLKYDTIPGLFKQICDKAKKIETSKIKVDWDNPDYYKMSLGGKKRQDVHEWCLENDVITLGYGGEDDLSELKEIDSWKEYKKLFKEKHSQLVSETRFHTQAAYWFMNMKEGDIVVISKGNHIIDAVGVVKGDYYWDDNNQFEFYHFRKVEWIAKNLNTSPDRFFSNNITQQAIYNLKKSNIKIDSFKELTEEKRIKKNYVLIIDEINRGNVSQIFGELITLIEEDKRKGREEELEVMLPYSKKPFSVPDNLYIIGTMNTADRSVEALDTALRRRFCFFEMPSKPEIITEEGKAENGEIAGIKLEPLLRTINDRIERLLDRDHCIGHSYFLNIDSIEGLKSAFKDKIIPLLQEYFYGDYGKIGLVLGNGFVEISNNKSPFAKFDSNYDPSGLEDRLVFKLKPIADDTFIEAVKSIYE